MVTIFTMPKPFTGHTAVLQRNAIASWRRLEGVEILLMGNDPGIKEAAATFSCVHVGDVTVNEFNTPLLNSAFFIAAGRASRPILAFVNADIIFTADLIAALKQIKLPPRYVIVGQRGDLDMEGPLSFEPGWEQTLASKSRPHGFTGMDYCLFPRSLDIKMPAFAVGRQGWDNWFLWHMRSRSIPVIDATGTVTALHQNHDYGHSRYAEKTRVAGPETERNFALTGSFRHICTLMDADWVIRDGRINRPPFPRRIIPMLSLFYPWQALLAAKRKYQSRMTQ